MARTSAKGRRKLELDHERRKDGLRRKYPEIRGKLLDYITHSYGDGWLHVILYFADATNFSLHFTVNEPSIVPKLIEVWEIRGG